MYNCLSNILLGQINWLLLTITTVIRDAIAACFKSYLYVKEKIEPNKVNINMSKLDDLSKLIVFREFRNFVHEFGIDFEVKRTPTGEYYSEATDFYTLWQDQRLARDTFYNRMAEREGKILKINGVKSLSNEWYKNCQSGACLFLWMWAAKYLPLISNAEKIEHFVSGINVKGFLKNKDKIMNGNFKSLIAKYDDVQMTKTLSSNQDGHVLAYNQLNFTTVGRALISAGFPVIGNMQDDVPESDSDSGGGGGGESDSENSKKSEESVDETKTAQEPEPKVQFEPDGDGDVYIEENAATGAQRQLFVSTPHPRDTDKTRQMIADAKAIIINTHQVKEACLNKNFDWFCVSTGVTQKALIDMMMPICKKNEEMRDTTTPTKKNQLDEIKSPTMVPKIEQEFPLTDFGTAYELYAYMTNNLLRLKTGDFPTFDEEKSATMQRMGEMATGFVINTMENGVAVATIMTHLDLFLKLLNPDGVS